MNTFPVDAKFPERRLRVKFGIDPTAPRLHLGHFVPLRQVRHFKRDGHEILIVLGNFTAQMGDPSGRETSRPILNQEQTVSNSKSIKMQVERVLGPTTFCSNLVMKNAMTIDRFFEIASKFTFAQITEREAFQKRIENNHPIGLHEILVPIMQGWDSVFLKADVEIGGQDQLFNFKVARKMQEDVGQEPQICVMMPIINGTDGRKMSKSLDNCIFLDDSPEDIFGKCMSVPDSIMEEWIPILCDVKELPEHPMERKKVMAFDITKQIWCEDDARFAQKHFESIIQSKEVPEELPEVKATDLVEAVRLIRKVSKGEANRLIKSGGVKIDGNKQTDNCSVEIGNIVKVGKREFGKIA